jgi:hypothetical protein
MSSFYEQPLPKDREKELTTATFTGNIEKS